MRLTLLLQSKHMMSNHFLFVKNELSEMRNVDLLRLSQDHHRVRAFRQRTRRLSAPIKSGRLAQGEEAPQSYRQLKIVFRKHYLNVQYHRINLKGGWEPSKLV